MTEKYIDLAGRITDEIGGFKSAHSVTLRWLDQLASEHPDQVPGRTMTAGEVGRNAHLVRSVPIAGMVETPTIIDFLESLGFTVVPDPEPTNADKLADYVRQISRTAMSAEECGKWLDEQGVKAPGGDDDH